MSGTWIRRRTAVLRQGSGPGQVPAGVPTSPIDARRLTAEADEVWLQPLAVTAKAYGVSPGRMARMARQGAVEGAVQVARRWYFPAPAGTLPHPAPVAVKDHARTPDRHTATGVPATA